MISGYSIYLMSGLVAVVVLTCIAGLKVVPLPPNRSLRLYVIFRSLFGHLSLAAIAWLWGRQLGLGLYLLVCCAYEILLLAYFSHFHFIPSLRLVIAIRREAIMVAKELITGGFLYLEMTILLVYAGIFAILHLVYASITGEYLDAILRSIAPVAVVGYVLVITVGIATTMRTNRASIGQLFSYHNMLKIFGPFLWQTAYSFADSEREHYNRQLPLVRLRGRAGARPRDLIFIQLESVGSPMVQAVHNGQPVMPNLQALAQQSIFFPRMISAKGRGGTSDVELAMFTGRMHAATDAPILDEYYDYSSSIFRALVKQGYQAHAFHGNTGAFFKRSYAYDKMGAEFYDQVRMKLPDSGWGAADGDVLRFASDRLAAVQEPVVAAIILMTSHTPFTNIDRIEPDAGDAGSSMHDRYCRSVRYVDREVAKFIESYSALKPDTVFAVYADHGARVSGHRVNNTVMHDNAKRDAVPGWIYFKDGVPRCDAGTITLPTFALLALAQLGLRVDLHTEGVPHHFQPHTHENA
jgi:glucan phosphoethanolaminetransferase (alkaline phosphatase superfamily)